MAAIAAWVESRSALAQLRRTLPPGGPSLVACRTIVALRRVLATRLVDALVLSPGEPELAAVQEFRAAFPEIPLLVLAPFRPDDGALLLACHRLRTAAVLVEGVDDPVLGEVVARSTATVERCQALADAPRLLRLTEPLQRQVWHLLQERVDQPMRTGAIARRVRVSREHLSRQFAAGGAPNLKRVIDLTRIACAAQLLSNPGYDTRAVVRVLGFASSSHLSGTARRIASVSTRELGALGPRGVLAAFARGNTRSRLG